MLIPLKKQPHGLYVTGVTTSFVAGDDGEYEAGYLKPNRFITIDDDLFYDSFTDLYWPRSAVDFGRTGTKTYSGALELAIIANTAVFAGYNDWRLPNIRELFSLVDYEQTSTGDYSWPDCPWISGRLATEHWTSTIEGHLTSDAYLVSFINGKIFGRPQSTTREVVIVRGGLV